MLQKYTFRTEIAPAGGAAGGSNADLRGSQGISGDLSGSQGMSGDLRVSHGVPGVSAGLKGLSGGLGRSSKVHYRGLGR